MALVAGVDGCRGGWITALVEKVPAGASIRFQLFQRFEEVLALSPTIIAIDIPIGLLGTPQAGGRECDRQARKMLAPLRASSVFSPLCRKFLNAKDFSDVQGMSLQTFCIMPKIREVDGLMTPKLQNIVREAHPELAFMSLVGYPIHFKKKKPQGREKRLQALESGGFVGIKQAIEKEIKMLRKEGVARDDLIDACVMAWVALRIADGKAQRVPTDPPLDSMGLRMEIWY